MIILTGPFGKSKAAEGVVALAAFVFEAKMKSDALIIKNSPILKVMKGLRALMELVTCFYVVAFDERRIVTSLFVHGTCEGG